jgi:hypothetical protein
MLIAGFVGLGVLVYRRTTKERCCSRSLDKEYAWDFGETVVGRSFYLRSEIKSSTGRSVSGQDHVAVHESVPGPKPTSRHIRYSVAIGVKVDIEQASPSASSIYVYTP